METNQLPRTVAEQSDVQTYRAISPLAIVTCVLAVASALALAHPVLWFVPVVTVAVAVLALRSISRSPDTLMGHKAALVGLAVALFFGAWAPTRLVLQRFVLPRHARHFTEYWLNLVCEGRIREAHQWTEPPAFRVPPDVDLREFYESDSDAKEDFEEFLQDEPMRSLVQLGRSAEPQFAKTASVEGDSQKGMCVLHFDIAAKETTTDPLAVRIAAERTVNADTHMVQWRVLNIQPVHAEEHEHDHENP